MKKNGKRIECYPTASIQADYSKYVFFYSSHQSQEMRAIEPRFALSRPSIECCTARY
uniref:Uncharacterized protein n=1 Tax=Heterorhabditis bacteriophora TaxID=37862 RepID=A0A1I7X030_HETBA